MMIGPKGYIMMHEKDSFPQLIKERNKLVAELKRLEKLVFDDKERLDDAWKFKPGPDVHYQVTLEYLAELCLFIEEKYNKEIVHKRAFENKDFDEEESAGTIEVQKIGITKLEVDAVVNAANDRLAEGGGVCGVVFREAGSAALTRACAAIGSCKTGNAVITLGFNLPAKYIIHAVGPVWQGGTHNEPKLLYSAYKQSLLVAKENDCHSIGFPLISGGIFGYPKDQAWRKAIQACNDFINNNHDYQIKIIFAVLDDEMKALGDKTIRDICESN